MTDTAMSSESAGAPPRLGRVLRLRDLIIYGIVIIQPIAAVPIFGVVQDLSGGHAVTAVVIAGIAMMLTAYSYGRMAALYPSAGSAYSYVGRGLNPHLGFLAGWAMALDYLIFPIVALIQAAFTIERLIPQIPYAGWVIAFVVLLTGVNLRGIRTTARTNIILLIAMFVVIGIFLVCVIAYLLRFDGLGGLFSTRPFYTPQTFDVVTIASATSFAALTFIGFDGVTTLAEDVKNPQRNVMLATVIVCAFTTLFSGLLLYLAQLAWPEGQVFANAETAFMDVTRLVGGALLFQAVGLLILVGSLGSGLAAQVAAGRLLFAMGRDDVLPRKVFGQLNPLTNTPTFNVILIGALALAGALTLSLEHAGALLNFGAFLSFMGVNLAALYQGWFVRAREGQRRAISDALIPALGFVFCLGLWLNLPTLAKIVGGLWFLAGLAYAAYRTRGFREPAVMLDFDQR